MIYHFYCEYESRNPDTARCNRLAKESWAKQPWTEIPVLDEDLPRLWVERGKKLPLIQDLFDYAAARASDEDILVYTNTDIQVRSDTCKQIENKLQDLDACIARRRDFNRIDNVLEDSEFEKGGLSYGIDLMAFKPHWWAENRSSMAGLIVGISFWDWIFWYLVQETHTETDTQLYNLLAHERGGPSWWELNRSCFAQKQNQSIAYAFFKKNSKTLVDPVLGSFGLRDVRRSGAKKHKVPGHFIRANTR